MEKITMMIKSDPLPAARPRFSGRRAYQTARNREYRREVEMTARLAMKDKAPLTGALAADVKLYRRYQPTSRKFGDVDNHLKALFDGMTGIVFCDDAQIVRCVVEKYLSRENLRAEIEIRRIKS